jgi:GTP pyrophosphokinase
MSLVYKYIFIEVHFLSLMKQLCEKARILNTELNEELLTKAFQVAASAHKEQKRMTGEEYIVHPIAVAQLVLEMGFSDTASLCAALLHDTQEDTHITKETLQKEFGHEIADLVDSLTKLDKKSFSSEKSYSAENIRKIILATAKDPRVMIIKIADRLHNMQTLDVHNVERQHKIATETMNIYVPLAEKLGLVYAQQHLEYYCMQYLQPDAFTQLQNQLIMNREEREAVINQVKLKIENLLQNYNCLIFGRAKNYYSIYKKMDSKDKTLDEIYDLFGIRILTPTVPTCYEVLALLRENFSEHPAINKDYIMAPKTNGYQSLHNTFTIDNHLIEIQIRTKEMDNHAESGAATHWKYKKLEKDKRFDQKINWIKQFIRWFTTNPHAKNIREVMIDVFKNEIIAITPEGDPIILPEGASVVDFAFAIHSKVGSHAIRAEINGEPAALNEVVQSGDIVKVITSLHTTVSSSWIPYAKSNDTITKIKRELNIPIERRSPKESRENKKIHQQKKEELNSISQLEAVVGKSKIKLSQCCSPKMGNKIVAYYTRDKKTVTVHKIDCPNQFALDQKLKLHITWKDPQEKICKIKISAKDTPGIILTVLEEVSQATSIESVTTTDRKNRILIEFMVEHNDTIEQLTQHLRSLPDIIDIFTEQ